MKKLFNNDYLLIYAFFLLIVFALFVLRIIPTVSMMFGIDLFLLFLLVVYYIFIDRTDNHE